MFADKCLSFFNVGYSGRAGILISRDCPYRLVGDNDAVNIAVADFIQTVGELAINCSGGFAIFAFHCGFADAENWRNVVTQGGGDFLGDIFFGFIEDMTTLRMADDSIINEASDLRNGCFAGEGAIVAPVEVLSGKFELSTIDLE